eukprot:5415168-Pleurochrysis_carterae.AAC.1
MSSVLRAMCCATEITARKGLNSEAGRGVRGRVERTKRVDTESSGPSNSSLVRTRSREAVTLVMFRDPHE